MLFLLLVINSLMHVACREAELACSLGSLIVLEASVAWLKKVPVGAVTAWLLEKLNGRQVRYGRNSVSLLFEFTCVPVRD